jgi:putative two-component system response regulator
LTPEEWELIKKHPEVGASIIEPLTFMKRERDIIRHHHERIDGGGYPDGIGGHELDPSPGLSPLPTALMP